MLVGHCALWSRAAVLQLPVSAFWLERGCFFSGASAMQPHRCTDAVCSRLSAGAHSSGVESAVANCWGVHQARLLTGVLPNLGSQPTVFQPRFLSTIAFCRLPTPLPTPLTPFGFTHGCCIIVVCRLSRCSTMEVQLYWERHLPCGCPLAWTTAEPPE